MNDRDNQDQDDCDEGARRTAVWHVYPTTAPPPISTQPPTSKPTNIREFKKGECIDNLSDDPNAFLVVQIGRVHVYVVDAIGKNTHLLEELTGGDVIVRRPVSASNDFHIRYQAADPRVTVKIVSNETEPDINVLLRLSREAIKQLTRQHERLTMQYAQRIPKEARTDTAPAVKTAVRKVLPKAFLADETQRQEEARAEADNIVFRLLGENMTTAEKAAVKAAHDKMMPFWHLRSSQADEEAPEIATNKTVPDLVLDIDFGDLAVSSKAPPISVRVSHDQAPSTQPATPVAQQAARASATPLASTPVPPSSAAPAPSGRYADIRPARPRTDRVTLTSAIAAPAPTQTQLRPPPPPVHIPPPPKPAMQAEELKDEAPCKTRDYDKNFHERDLSQSS